MGNISNICLVLGWILQSAPISVLPQRFPVSHRDAFTLVQVYSNKLVIAVHGCTLSKLVAWSDPYVSVVSRSTYTNYLCWPQARVKQETTEAKEHRLPTRHSYASDKCREPVLTSAAVQLLQCSSVFLQNERA